MIDYSLLCEKFNAEKVDEGKILVKENLLTVLNFLKNTPEFDFNILTSIVAVDLFEKIEIIYQLYSLSNNLTLNLSYFTENNSVPSATEVYKSAYFDECEIFDLMGVEFSGNKNLRRLLLPKSWKGHPLLKSYKQEDERLSWNE